MRHLLDLRQGKALGRIIEAVAIGPGAQHEIQQPFGSALAAELLARLLGGQVFAWAPGLADPGGQHPGKEQLVEVLRGCAVRARRHLQQSPAQVLCPGRRVDRTGARARGPIDVEHLHRFEARSRKLLQTWRSDGPTPEVERELRSLIPMAREAASTTSAGGKIVNVPGPYLPIYQKAHDWLSRIYLDDGREDAAIALLDNAVERHPEAEYFHRKLTGVYAELGQRALADEYFQRSNGLAQRYVLSVTRANYHTAAGMLRDQGIQIVAMQYPLRSLGTLRYLMDDAHDVVFIDNETVFREAVSRDGYDAVFVDRFAGDFGHGTRRGNELITRNLLDTVFEPLFGG